MPVCSDVGDFRRARAQIAFLPNAGCKRVSVADEHSIGFFGQLVFEFHLLLSDLQELFVMPLVMKKSLSSDVYLGIFTSIFRNPNGVKMGCQFLRECSFAGGFCTDDSHPLYHAVA